MNAQKLLASFAIGSRIVGADSASSARGCAYALSLGCRELRGAEAILDRYGIKHGAGRKNGGQERK